MVLAIDGSDALRAYPAEAPPWPSGRGVARPDVLLARARRLERVRDLLSRFDVDLVAGVAAAEPSVLAGALDAWSLAQWPAMVRREWASPEAFYAHHWTHAEQASVYTLLVDVGVALGELLMRHRPGFVWGVDRYEAHEADGVESFGRLVLLDPQVTSDSAAPRVYDAIDESFMRYQSLVFDDGVPGSFIDAMQPMLWDARGQLAR